MGTSGISECNGLVANTLQKHRWFFNTQIYSRKLADYPLSCQKPQEINSLNIEGESKKAIVNVRVNQGKFRDLLLRRYKSCCLCGMKNTALLIASHIKPWVNSEPKEKLDVNNGFLMCPNHDRLFDKGYITFDNDGKIIISNRLTENDRVYLNVNSKMHLNVELIDDNKKYLKFHREKVFENEKLEL